MKRFIKTIWLLSWGVVSLPAEGGTIYLLHTNNTNGALENCYCPDHPLGAVEKRAVFVGSFLEEHPNTVVVDAGDFFAVLERYRLKDSLICEAYATIPYNALLLGDQELTREVAFLNAVLPRSGAPLVVTNLQDPRPEGVLPYRIVERGGIRVGIMGVVGPAAFKYYPAAVRERIALKDPLTAILETLPEVRKQVDIVVVLSHQGLDRDRKLARRLQGVDVIIGAHSQTVLKTPIRENDIVIAQAGKDGYYVGILELTLDDRHRVVDYQGWVEPMTLEMPDHPRVMQLIEEYERRTGLVNRNKLKLRKGAQWNRSLKP
jgi:2',3'-cyclic-nucleotide 2'-phosphodiesterase (5'-nucleotidase family)